MTLTYNDNPVKDGIIYRRIDIPSGNENEANLETDSQDKQGTTLKHEWLAVYVESNKYYTKLYRNKEVSIFTNYYHFTYY
jgi:hypothetical protein